MAQLVKSLPAKQGTLQVYIVTHREQSYLFNCSFSKMVKHKESQLGRNKVNASRL